MRLAAVILSVWLVALVVQANGGVSHTVASIYLPTVNLP